MGDYRINSQVVVSITHCSQVALFGIIDNHTRAIIRAREISWNAPLAFESYINRSFQAIIIGFDDVQEQLELSLRLIEHDPWKKAEIKYALGREVEGTVVGLIEDAAFVNLEPGIDAFLPLSEVPWTTPCRIEELLWINDHIKAKVVELAPQQRRLRISIRDLVAEREKEFNRQMWNSQFHEASSGVTIAEYIPKDTRLRLLRMSAEDRDINSALELHVLIIEDDEIFGTALCSLLQANGCQVVLARESVSGLDYIDHRDSDFHLIILDWNLPTLKGHQILKRLRDARSQSRIVTILDSSYLKNFPDIWNSILECNTDVLSKSNNDSLTIGLLSILRELRQEKPQRTMEQRRQVQRLENSFSAQNMSLSMNESAQVVDNNDDKLLSILGGLQSDTHASTIAIICLDPVHPMPRVELCTGKPLLLREASPDVLYSPLGDVLQKQQEVYIEVRSNTSRFNRLLVLLKFHGLIGIPIPMSDTTVYGLLLFKENQGFDQTALQQARANAYLIGGML
ncbi:MAG TPA: S1 RNA-binding domain-containing protein, partial [Anaerolineales bacterium]|nr:S1 RNA-binding domain-containing protein [Anaerolineales bacterium]